MARTVRCPAGAWTYLFWDIFVQLPWSWRVSFHAADGGAVEGEAEQRASAWVIPSPPTSMALTPQMSFRRGWWNTFYSVRVRPTRDLVATIE